MRITETKKRTVQRSEITIRRTDLVGYRNLVGASLSIHMPNGYAVEITFEDLAYLVKAADEHAAKINPEYLKNWRSFATTERSPAEIARLARIEAKYSTEEGATEEERQEAYRIVMTTHLPSSKPSKP